MHINENERVLVYTNIFFLVPVIIGIVHKNWNITILLIVFIVFSTLYHIYRKPGAEWWWRTEGRSLIQTFLLLSEIVLALILAVWSFLLLLQKPPMLTAIAIVLFIPSFFMFLSTNYRKYPLYHSIWHTTSAIIITLALI